MKLKVIQTDQAPAAIGPYSQGIGAGSLLFVSGQLGMDPESGELAGAAIETQARRALENLREIVLAGGGNLNQVVAVDVFLTDIGDFAVFNDIYQEFFTEHRPARAVVEVSALPRGGCVEIKCIAYLE